MRIYDLRLAIYERVKGASFGEGAEAAISEFKGGSLTDRVDRFLEREALGIANSKGAEGRVQGSKAEGRRVWEPVGAILCKSLISHFCPLQVLDFPLFPTCFWGWVAKLQVQSPKLKTEGVVKNRGKSCYYGIWRFFVFKGGDLEGVNNLWSSFNNLGLSD